MNVIQLIKILDEISITSQVQIKDAFGKAEIEKVYYDKETDTVIIEID